MIGKPAASPALMGQAMALHRDGNLAEAEAIYSQLLGKNPNDFHAQHFLGVLRYQQGRHDEALRLIGTALMTKADDASAQFHHGLVLASLKRQEDAVASFDRALSIKPDNPEALYHRATALHALHRLEEVLATYDRLVAVKPDHIEVLTNRGNVLRDLGRHEEAVASYDAALAIKPDLAVALYNRGVVFQDLRRLEDALASFDQALAVNPEHVETLNNRGNVLRDLNRLDEGLASYERSLAVKPDFAEALNNRATALRDLNRLDEALTNYDRAIALKPDYAQALFNRGMCRLLAGQYARGWADFEWRWAAPKHPRQPQHCVNWRGEDLKGRRLLVFAEQGLGDVIQYARYLPMVADRTGCALTFLATPSLIRLLQHVTRGIEVAGSLPRELEFDFQCALMSLPHRLGTDEDSIPAVVPYLSAEDALIDRWQKHIGSHGFKVGICWQGNPNAPAKLGRSIPLSQFRPLGQVPGVRLISLQKNHGLDQLARIPVDMTVETLGDGFDAGPDAFVDCAAVIHCLDLVVTSDTAVAHLAGALGRPVWLAIQHVPHWTWMLDRADSPWYPSMRLFRQTRRGDWASVFHEMALALRRLVSQHGRQPVARPGNPCVPISWGDLIDKITILEVKAERLTSEQALANVSRERAALEAVLQAHGNHSSRVVELRTALRAVNARLFDVEDAIREREARQLFDSEFIQLARSIYFSNDERGRIKREINTILNSEFVEEKQYAKY